MLCFVVVMQSFIMNSHEVFIHIHQGCFAGTGAIVRLPQCQWSKPDGYGKISQCITTTKHSKAKTVCIFLGIYCNYRLLMHSRGVMALGQHWFRQWIATQRHQNILTNYEWYPAIEHFRAKFPIQKCVWILHMNILEHNLPLIAQTHCNNSRGYLMYMWYACTSSIDINRRFYKNFGARNRYPQHESVIAPHSIQ